MAAKAAQLAQWLKELQERVNADGNLSYNEIIRFTKEKSLTQKQLDGIFNLLHEHNIDLVYDEDEDAGEPDEADFSEDDDLSEELILEMKKTAWKRIRIGAAAIQRKRKRQTTELPAASAILSGSISANAAPIRCSVRNRKWTWPRSLKGQEERRYAGGEGSGQKC